MSEEANNQRLNINRNHQGDFEFTSTTSAIDSWKTWNNDLWAKIAYLIAEEREASILRKIAVGEANPAADNPEYHDFTDGDDHFVMSESRKWPEDELHEVLDESDSFERGDLWIGLTRENASINPSSIFADVFSHLLQGDAQIDESHDVECVGRVENGQKLLWHHLDTEKWGILETKVHKLAKDLKMDLFINGVQRE